MDLSKEERRKLWDFLILNIENYYSELDSLSVSPPLDKKAINDFILAKLSEDPGNYTDAVSHVAEGFKKYIVHTPHPRYFGLYNPRSNFAGIVGDTLTAAFNPQLAAWSHSPFAQEVESILITLFGKKFGYAGESTDGCFATGGAEANLTALICALNKRFPEYSKKGLQSLHAMPGVYCSSESHHSIIKAAANTGIGIDSVRIIPADGLRMNIRKLEDKILADINAGFTPVMINATMGTTGTGTIDDITSIHKIAEKYNCWLHADAAYGGAVVLNEKYRSFLSGIQLANSITFDAHKWLSVPMGASMFITRDRNILSKSFGIRTEYMPRDAGNLEITDPYSHTIQWSRRFIGLKLYMTLLFYGWEGLSDLVEKQVESGQYLKNRLMDAGWIIYNDSALPVVCFGKKIFEEDKNAAPEACQKIVRSGKAWISVYNVNGVNVLRACITNYKTGKKDIDQLIDILGTMVQTSS